MATIPVNLDANRTITLRYSKVPALEFRFQACKFPGAGDPTNTILVETDRGAIGRFESGTKGSTAHPIPEETWATITVPLPAGAKWVSLKNEDGSAIIVRKYPTVDGRPLTDDSIIERSPYFANYGEFWALDLVKFRLGV